MKKVLFVAAVLAAVSVAPAFAQTAEATKLDVPAIQKDLTTLKGAMVEYNMNTVFIDRQPIQGNGVSALYSEKNRWLLEESALIGDRTVNAMGPAGTVPWDIAPARLHTQLGARWLDAANLMSEPSYVVMAQAELDAVYASMPSM
jgi:hypothetical protein